MAFAHGLARCRAAAPSISARIVIEIEPQPLAVTLERKGRLLVARPVTKAPVLRATTIERTRRTLAAGRGRR
jgi:hypothetical protein